MPRVESNGIGIHYEARGAGEPLVLLMGLGADGGLWEDHVACYEKHFRCILMDNRGAGRSEKPPGEYATATMADDTAGLMDALGIARARVAGISMGSGIAQELALRHPAKVRSLVLISSWAVCDRYMRDVFEHFAVVRAKVAPAEFVQLLQLWIFAPARYAAHYAELLEGRAGAGENPMPQHAFAAQCAACMNHDTLARLAAIRQPALLTVGDADIFTPLGCSEAMAARLPAATLEVFPGRGHCHHWEDLERFNRLTCAFLQAH